MSRVGSIVLTALLCAGLAAAVAAAQAPPLESDPGWESGPANFTRAIALGDIDGDGRLDLLCASLGQANTLFPASGDAFATASVWSGGSASTLAIAVGDIDGDGDLDVVCGNGGANALYINDGGVIAATPVWTSAATFTTADIALGDIDGDGLVDLVCADDNDGVRVYRNAGGTFAEPPLWSSAANRTISVAIGDIDGDDRIDLVCGNLGEANTLYLNTGTTLETAPSWASDSTLSTLAVALGDIDGDGDLDLVCANTEQNTGYRNLGATLETAPVWVSNASVPAMSVDIGDVDIDGDLDVVFGNNGASNELYLNQGNALGVDPVWSSSRTNTTAGIALADADGDGDLDVVCGNSNQTNTVYRNVSPPFADAPDWLSTVANQTLSIALGDVTGDGAPDLVAGNQLANTLYRGGFAPFETSPSWTSGSADLTAGVALGDIDGDTRPDLVTANAGANGVYFNNAGQLSTVAGWTSPDAATTSAVALGDMTGNGWLDLVFAYTSQDNRIHVNDSGTIVDAPLWTSPSASAAGVALGDVDGDGDLDIVFANTDDNANTLFHNSRTGISTSPVWSSNLGNRSAGVALGDVNGDGVLDAIFANASQVNTLYLGGGGVFALDPAWSSGPAGASTCVALGDIDGDGDLDAVFGNHSEPNTLYINDGGALATSPLWSSTRDAGTDDVALDDLDGDGDLDAVFGNQAGVLVPATGENTAWLGRRNPPLRGDLAAPVSHTANNPAFVSSLRVTQTAANERRVHVTLADVESDPVWLVVEYQFEGEPVWRRADTGTGGRVGPLASSPAGTESSFQWNISSLPFDRRDVVLRVRALEMPSRVSAVQRVPTYVRRLGPLTPLRPEMTIVTESLVFPTVTVGDTVESAILITNTGNATLSITNAVLPSDEMVFVFQILPELEPGASDLMRIALLPEAELSVSGHVIIESNDPLTPVDSVAVTTDIRALRVASRLLAGRPRIPLGEAATVIVEPFPDVRVESGSLFSRAVGEKTFRQIPLGRSADDFIGLIPGASVSEVGIEYYVEVRNSGVTATDPPGAPLDSLILQAVLPPTEVTAVPRTTSGNDFLEGEPIRVDISLPQGAVFSDGTLYFRPGGGEKYEATSISMEFAVPSATIPDSIVGPRGIDYRVEVTTATATLLDPPAVSPWPHSISVLVPNLVEPASHPGQQYRLFSIPLVMNGSILGAFADDLGGVDNTVWRLFGYDTGSRGYNELPRTGEREFMHGRAYWLVTRDAHRIGTGDDDGYSSHTNIPFEITLEPGYNLVGTPYAFDLAWENSYVDTLSVADTLAAAVVEPPVAWVAGRGYRYDVKTLVPFDGYWIRNLTGAPVRLRIPAIAAAEPRAAASTAAADGWRLQLVASAAGAIESAGEFGTAPGARAGWDRFDRALPPPVPGNSVGVCFPHGEWESMAGRYARDLRGDSSQQGMVWFADVAKSYSTESGGDDVTLSVRGLDTLPEGVSAVLVDRRLAKRVDLSPEAEYRFYLGVHKAAATRDRARFAVIVGDEAFVTAEAEALIDMPRRTALHQNHPNPFNPATVIAYDLAEPARVSVRIYDVRGALVRVLEERRRGPGRYEIGWDGTDDRGSRVASGVYFYRLEAGRFIATRKMVLLK